MGGSHRETLAVEIDPDLKALIDADSRYNYQIVESAGWREFGGRGKSGLEQRLSELQARRKLVTQEIEERESERTEIDQEIEAVRSKMESMADVRESALEAAEDVLGLHQLDPENPAVEKWAGEADIPVEEFIDEMEERLR